MRPAKESPAGWCPASTAPEAARCFEVDSKKCFNVILEARKRNETSRSNKILGGSLLVVFLATFFLFLSGFKGSRVCVSASNLADFDGATFYKAPLGSRVRIACNGSHWNDDSVSLVLWFKGTIESHSVPIYTVDARQKPLNSGARHFIADAYKGRAKFVTRATPPYLDLSPLEADDQSEYRCRIDYRSKPRENFLIILFVLVPPKSVQIVDSSGRSFEQIYGPLSEASDLTLLCLSKGGRPAPAITWRSRNKVIDDSYLTLNDFQALKRAGQMLLAPQNNSLNDNNQPAPNPINADPSFGQLNALWRDWHTWPEFDFFASQRRNAAAANDGNNSSSAPLAGSEPQAPLLLTLDVHDSITTAVNVLRLTGVGGSLSGREWAEERAGQPQLECQASNAHYDLRTLIKQFAPPSLTGSQPARARPTGGAQPDGAFSSALNLQERQLVAAIEGAIEATLRDNQTDLSGGHQQNQLQLQQEAAATALRQIKLEANSTTGADDFPDSTTTPTRHSNSRANVIYHQLTRPHQLSNLQESTNRQPTTTSTAGASNPLMRSQLIALDVYFRPLDVKISGSPRPLSAGQLAEFSCTSSGSQPAAKLSWWKDKQLLDSRLSRQVNEFGGNISHSKLSLHLSQQDNGAQLACRAENEQLNDMNKYDLVNNESATNFRLEDSRTLTVHYAPKLHLELGNKILSSTIREGSDIYFVCNIEAVPTVKDITWLHNERPVNESSGAPDKELRFGEGLIISNNSLVLQRVRVEQRGYYACMASNSEGVSESNRIELRVLHAPICSSGSNRNAAMAGTRALSLQGRARFSCQMEADPPEIELTWYLNNSHSERRVLLKEQLSGEAEQAKSPGQQNNNNNNKELTEKRARFSAPASQLNYLVESVLDYGRLYCVARNSIGEQKRACIYEIKAPDPTEAPGFTCLAVNVSSASVWIGCSELHSSRTQHLYKFAIELFSVGPTQSSQATTNLATKRQQNEREQEPQSNHLDDDGEHDDDDYLSESQLELVANISSNSLPEPLFSVNNLRPQTSYLIRIKPFDLFTGHLSGSSSSVHFSTSQSSLLEMGQIGDKPTIEQIAQPNLLLSALISTRSTNNNHQQQLEQASVNNQQLKQHSSASSKRQQQTSGLFDSVFGSLFRVFYPNSSGLDVSNGANLANKRLISKPFTDSSNQLMDVSDTLLITSLCLLLFASLTGVLILYRYSSRVCADRQYLEKQKQDKNKRKIKESCMTNGIDLMNSASTTASTSSSSDSSAIATNKLTLEANGGDKQMATSLNAFNIKHRHQINQSVEELEDTTTFTIDCYALPQQTKNGALNSLPQATNSTNQSHANTATYLHSSSSSQPSSSFAPGASYFMQPASASARLSSAISGSTTLDSRNPKSRTNLPQNSNKDSIAKCTSSAPFCVTKSRSSFCLESYLLGQQLQMQEKQENGIQLSGVEAGQHLISDADLLKTQQQQQQLNNFPCNPSATEAGEMQLLQYDANLNRCYIEDSQRNESMLQLLTNQNQLNKLSPNSKPYARIANSKQLVNIVLSNQAQNSNNFQQIIQHRPSSSLISDESSADSNAIMHNNWSLPDNFDPSSSEHQYNLNHQQHQMHFIELLPADSNILDVNLISDMFCPVNLAANQQSTDDSNTNNLSYHAANQVKTNVLCPSITSSSVGSSLSAKDQPISSPLSIQTLSNAESPFNSNICSKSNPQTNTIKRAEQSNGASLTSILKNSKHNQQNNFDLQEQSSDNDFCHCNNKTIKSTNEN